MATDLLTELLYSHLDPMSLPVLLQLLEVLIAFLSHPAFVDFILVISNCTAHLVVTRSADWKHCQSQLANLQRIQVLHRLDGCDEIGELGDRGQTLSTILATQRQSICHRITHL